MHLLTVNQQILAAIKFGISQNKVIYVNLAAIKFGVSPRPVYAVYDRRICWRRQILAKTRNSPNSQNIIARQNLLIYSTYLLYIVQAANHNSHISYGIHQADDDYFNGSNSTLLHY